MRQPRHEKIKPFRLVKYFSILSLTAIFIGTLLLSVLNTQWARSIQYQKSEDYARLLVENLNHQIFSQVLIPVAIQYGEIKTRNEPVFTLLDTVIRNTLHSFSVEMLNMYDQHNTVVYSFNTGIMGQKEIAGPGYEAALKGETTSRLEQRGNSFALFFGFARESRIITIAPLRAPAQISRLSGPIINVVEVVQNLSQDYKTIYRFQIQLILVITVVMSTLFLVLIIVVKRGESIMDRRALERIKLKEQLSRAAHLSSLGEMVAGVSHEIRNPLGIIKSSAELLRKKVATLDPGNQIPAIIMQESTRLNNIITDFLNFARPREPNRVPCRVDEVLEKNLSFLAANFESQGYDIRTRIDTKVPAIPADADMLYQAFLNILLNASQAMPAGGRIDIDVARIENGIQIGFRDHGRGIPDDLDLKIWDPFFTTKEKGTGLGLAIVRNIIEAHGGTIQITNLSAAKDEASATPESETSEGGALVTIRLPLSPDADLQSETDQIT